LLGSAGIWLSPRSRAARTLGDEATKWTGNPDFGRKVELLAPLLIPTGANLLARLAGPRASAGANDMADVAAPAAVAETK